MTGIAQDQDVGCGLILRAPVKIHEDIGSILISADIQSLGIGLAGEVEGIQVCHRAGWQHALELCAELIAAHRQHGEEAFLLPEGQPIHRDFGTGQFHGNIGLQFLQRIHVLCLQLQKYGAVEQRLLVLAQIRQQLNDILKVALRLDGFVHIIAAGFQLVAPGGVLHNLALLHAFHQPVVNAQGHTAAIRELCQNRLFLRGGRILPNDPYAPVGIPDDIVVGHKLDGAGQDAVEEILGSDFLHLRRSQHLGLALKHGDSSFCAEVPDILRRTAEGSQLLS